MTAVSLKELLPDALEKGYAIPGFVVLGWEDAISFVEASEEFTDNYTSRPSLQTAYAHPSIRQNV